MASAGVSLGAYALSRKTNGRSAGSASYWYFILAAITSGLGPEQAG
jgi:hypothetical protein